MRITVLYKDNNLGVVNPPLLDQLISSDKINKFLDPGGWVTLGIDPVRRKGDVYNGPERRRTMADAVEKHTYHVSAVLPPDISFSEMIIESLPGIFFLIDYRGRFLRWNRNLEQLSEYSAEEILAKNCLDFFNGEDRGIVEQKIQEVLAKGLASVEAELVSKNGNTIPLFFSGMKTVIHDVPCVIGMGIDITARLCLEKALRESESRFHSLFNSMTEGVALHKIIYDEKKTAMDYVVLDANPAYESHTGIARKDAIGSKASQLYGMGKPPFIDVYERVAATGQPVHFETFFKPMNKHFRISVFSPAKGQFATVFEDVTERTGIDAERERLINALQDAIAKVKQLSGMLPICASCKRIRDDNGYWQEVAAYITKHSEALFTHGICPDCAKKLYPDLIDAAGNIQRALPDVPPDSSKNGS